MWIHWRAGGAAPRLRKGPAVLERAEDPEPVRGVFVPHHVGAHHVVGVHGAPGEGVTRKIYIQLVRYESVVFLLVP